MAKNEKTILDTDETILDAEAADATLPDDVATMPDDATVLDGEATSGDKSASPVLEQGASLLDTYRIESDAIEGGMGAVWRVHHTGWNVDLAMKRPKSSLFQSEKQKENFVHECEAWINLGLHPYIVSCYYVREIGNVPSIFSEWMDGGSLKNAIEGERLYEGNAAERILDIAIQFARGLHYAHEQGLIHQDIKPDNLLLTKAWDAKVADFGIAKARATLTVLDADIPTDATIFSASGGYTPAYCSMEQMRGEPLTRRTDIYSWAVSVMEMYLGERPWQNGVIAGAACEEYFPDAKVAIPPKMQVLLKKCLNAKEAERPHDFAEVEKGLLETYREETKEEYPRPVSKAAADTADSLNNRALSFLDLGKPDEAERCWERAFALHGKNRKALYNHTLYQLLYDRIPSEEALNRYRAVEDNNSESNLFLVQLYALCGKWKEAKKLQQDISVPSMTRWQAELAATPNCRCALSFDGAVFLRAIQFESNHSWILEIRDAVKNQILTSVQIPTLNLHWFVSEIACDDQHRHIACIVGTLRSLESSCRFQRDRDGVIQSRRYEDYYLSNTKLLIWKLEKSRTTLWREIPLPGDAPYNRNTLMYQRGLAFLNDGRIAVLLKQERKSQEQTQYNTLVQYIFDLANGVLQARKIPVDCETNRYGFHQLSADGSVALIQTRDGMKLLWKDRLYPLPGGCVPRIETEETLGQAVISENGQVLGFSHVLEDGKLRIPLLKHSGGQKCEFLPYTATTWGKWGIREFQLSQDGHILFFFERTNEQHTHFRAVDTRTGRLLGAVELDAEVSAMLLSRDDQVVLLLGVDMQLLCRLELSNFFNRDNPYVLCRVTSSKENLRQEDILHKLLAEFETAFEPFDFDRCWDSIRRMVKDVPGFDGSELYLRLTERVQARSKKGKFIGAVLKQVFTPGCARSFYLLLPSGHKLVRIESDIVSYATAVEPIDLWHMDKQELIVLSLQGIANYSWFKHIDNTYSSLCEVDETRFIYAGILYEIREEGIHPTIKIHPCTRKPNGNSTFPMPVCVFPDRSSILNGDVITDFADGKKSCLPSEVLAGNPRCIRIASDGGRICYANSSTRDAVIFDCAKRAFTIRFEGHTDKVVHAEFLQNDTLVITLGQDKTMRVYDACTGENLKVMKTNIGKGICLVKSHDERCVLAIGEGMKAELWDITAYELLGVLQLSSGKMKTACFSPDDTQILIHNIEKGGAWLYALEYEYILK